MICGFACYLPLPFVRAALFCLFPGIAQRSISLAFKGAAIGVAVEFAFTIFWMMNAGAWEPRCSYNEFLVRYLPPDFMVATHVGSPMPNEFKFSIGLTCWMATMFAVWLNLWKPKFTHKQKVAAIIIGAIPVAISAVFLWIISPHDAWWQHGEKARVQLTPELWLLIFLSTVPACSLIMGLIIQRIDKLNRYAENGV